MNSFLRNTGIVGISRVVEYLISYLIIVILTRTLGAEGLGQYSFVFAFASFFFLFADFGLPSLAVRDLSKKVKDKEAYLSNIISFQLVLTIVSFLIFLIGVHLSNTPGLLLPLLLVGLYQVFFKLKNIPYSVLRVRQAGKQIAFVNILERGLSLIGAFFVLVHFRSLSLFILVLVLANAAKAFAVVFLAWKHMVFRPRLNFRFVGPHLKRALPFLMYGLFTIVYVRIDSVMLFFWQGDQIVGYYNAGYKLIDLLNVVPVLLMTFGFPMLSSLYKKRKLKAISFFEDLLYYAMLLALPVAVGVLFTSPDILLFIYKITGPDAANSFRILIFAEIFVFLTLIMCQMLAAADRQWVFAWIAGLGALLNILLNLVFIPSYSLLGAGAATLLTYFCMYTVLHIYIQKRLFRFRFLSRLALPAVACCAMAVVLATIPEVPLFWDISIGAMAYGLIIAPFEIYRLMS